MGKVTDLLGRPRVFESLGTKLALSVHNQPLVVSRVMKHCSLHPQKYIFKLHMDGTVIFCTKSQVVSLNRFV